MRRDREDGSDEKKVDLIRQTTGNTQGRKANQSHKLQVTRKSREGGGKEGSEYVSKARTGIIKIWTIAYKWEKKEIRGSECRGGREDSNVNKREGDGQRDEYAGQ